MNPNVSNRNLHLHFQFVRGYNTQIYSRISHQVVCREIQNVYEVAKLFLAK